MGVAHFIDTNVLAYASGAGHSLKPVCQELLTSAMEGRVELHASVEAVQELAIHRIRRSNAEERVRLARAAAGFLVLHPFDEQVLAAALDLMESHNIRGRDAVHIATAVAGGFDAIVSADKDFDDIPGLRRIDPREFA